MCAYCNNRFEWSILAQGFLPNLDSQSISLAVELLSGILLVSTALSKFLTGIKSGSEHDVQISSIQIMIGQSRLPIDAGRFRFETR
jgi:hypothetical protein